MGSTESLLIDLDQAADPISAKYNCGYAYGAKPGFALEWRMKISLIEIDSNQQPCTDCVVRPLSICAALDRAELRELEHLGRRVHFAPHETVFAQEELT